MSAAMAGPPAPPQGPDADGSAASIAAAIRGGFPLRDEEFDQLLPAEVRRISRTYWTPLAVALQVAKWLGEARVGSIVDVGSGVGKFGVVAALARPGLRVRGVEQRAALVEVARALVRALQLEARVSFEVGSIAAVPPAEAYYLYNPFGEHHYRPETRIDDAVEHSGRRFVEDVAAAEQLLSDAPAGTYVITYNGFGGQMPGTYRRVRQELGHPSVLEMWRKTVDEDLEAQLEHRMV
jgi:predicted RNA methylase